MSDVWGDIVGAIKSIPKGAEHDLSAVIHAAEGTPAALGHIAGLLTNLLSSVPMVAQDKAIEQAGRQAFTTQPTYKGTLSTVPGSGGQVGSSAEDQVKNYNPITGSGTPGKATDPAAPTTGLFNLAQAMQPYVQPYENMMDTLLGSKPGQAPTVAQAEKAGMSQLGPYLQGLPAGLAQTITAAARPEFAAAAGLPSAVNASVQTDAYAGLLTDLISAAKNQLVYGAGIGTPLPPGALGAVQQDVTQAGSGISGLGRTLGLGTTPAQSTTPSATSIPGG
jgi:hypothetical protein